MRCWIAGYPASCVRPDHPEDANKALGDRAERQLTVSLRRGPPCGLVQLVRQSLWTAISAVLSLNGLRWSRLVAGGAGRMTEKLRIGTESFQAPRAISSTARRHGISRSLLMTWRRSLVRRRLALERAIRLCRVVLAAEVEPAVAATPTSGQMVIVVGRDRRVIVDAGVDAAALARVLQVLERR